MLHKRCDIQKHLDGEILRLEEDYDVLSAGPDPEAAMAAYHRMEALKDVRYAIFDEREPQRG